MNTFYEQLMAEISADADTEKRVKDTSFLHKAISIINEKEDNEWELWTEALCERRIGNKIAKVDGFYFDSMETERLTLFICDFHNEPSENTRLTKSEIARQFKMLRNFYELANKGKIEVNVGNREVHALIQIITGQAEKPFDAETGYLELVLLTNKVVDGAVPLERETDSESGLRVQCRYYDLSRLQNSALEPVVLDFSECGNRGIPCLKVEKSEAVDFFDSYLFVMPAMTLAQSYENYRTRLLEGNVRAYLQQKGKVNKGMSATLREQPYVFFIYNNGLTMTADDIEFTANGTRVLRLHGARVVNGGQTMATIHDMWRSGVDIQEVSVQVKLTVVQKKVAEILVPNISHYSNSQNAVKDEDLYSNDILNRAIETSSRRCVTPKQNYWFYERFRGQYNSHIRHCSTKQVNAFERTNPKDKIITHTDFAKTFMVFEMQPSWVSLGGVKNLKRFRSEMTSVWENVVDKIRTAEWYKQCIAKRILFLKGTELIKNYVRKNAPNYSSCGAALNNYSIALLVHILREQTASINFKLVWDTQSAGSKICAALLECTSAIISYITEEYGANRLKTYAEWLKTEEGWKELRDKLTPTLRPRLARESFGKEAVHYMPELFFIEEMKIKKSSKSPAKQSVYDICPDHFWASLRDWLGPNPSPSMKSMATLVNKRLEHRRPLTNKECETLFNFAIQQFKSGRWAAPNLEADNEIIKTAAAILDTSNNPVTAFSSEQDQGDILALERTCDLQGGSLYIDELFARFPEIARLEQSSSDIEPGVAIAYSVTLPTGKEKKVILLYCRKSDRSVFYADLYSKALSQLHSYASADGDAPASILLHVGKAAPDDKIRTLISSELFTETVFYCVNDGESEPIISTNKV